eukprot:TRINITY_DN57979_c0_g1_i1.p1 TRINITY_DN57979_c0_g1~~TRINITY_DN57979_c0_g1_i1.p1  ORF type:complete len:238 (-),score=50.04 TRINITY_DN57979_c0_g1_i1:37-681(-)
MASAGNKILDALRALPSKNAPETLEIMEKLIQNVVKNPADDKYRRIKLTNAKIAAAITDVPGAVDALKQMGWIETPDGLSLPMSVSFAEDTEVLAIIEAREYFKNKAEDDKPSDKEVASAASCDGAAGEALDYRDYDGHNIRLVKHPDASPPHIEVFLEGASFWKGIPNFSYDSGRLTCGEKGASDVPESFREKMRQFLAGMPAQPVLVLSPGS